KPLLVSVDVYRPAAREQLRVVGGAVGIAVFENKETSDPMELVRGAMRHAQDTGHDTLLIDTAGRLHIDDELMTELERIKGAKKPLPEQRSGYGLRSDQQGAEVEQQTKRPEGTSESITQAGRNDHELVGASRKTRLGRGSGATIAEVSQVLREYEQMPKMMA